MVIQRTGHRYRDTETGKTLDVWFPVSGGRKSRHCLAEKMSLISGDFVEAVIDSLDAAPVSTEDAYLRLHLLSERAVKPNEINLEEIFGLLPNVAWTSAGPVLPGRVEDLRDRVAPEYHHLNVFSVDKFPRMTDYVVPAGVRIADADQRQAGRISRGWNHGHARGVCEFQCGHTG
jgi:2,3,4,5-tetrahydropyridine-2,6-dicarboxylate N-succinyltransferase